MGYVTEKNKLFTQPVFFAIRTIIRALIREEKLTYTYESVEQRR